MIQLEQLFVIVIEPSNMQRGIIVSCLKKFGLHNIDEYDSARPALNSMKSAMPDIVVSSMHLPDMSGTELVQEMRSDGELKDVTFILISSETHYRYLEPIRQAGAIAIIPKPFTHEELAAALNSTVHYIKESDIPEVQEDYEDLKVLLVDDSGMSRKYVRSLLGNMSINSVTEATDGAEALRCMEEGEAFDLIITDYNMPNVDGRELVEHIRTQSNQPTIPIMMITSEQDESRLAAIQHAGVSAICNKPFSYDNVKNLISRLIDET